MLEVRAATREDRDDVVRVMASAFDDDPVTRWLVPEGRSLVPLFRAHLGTANAHAQSVDVAVADGVAVGAAIWQEPGYRVSTWRQLAAIPAYARALGRHLGRGATVESVMHRARPHEEFWYLAGVGAVRRGEGIGSAMLRHRLDRVAGPAYLESSKQENISLYERFGFEQRDPIRVPGGPELWPMWRKG
ncbi:GNAT family N-acetyltransferase [Nocardioides cynanchi]|uniref:GNAT family N-acetyltransferase n=1 Tax=Nocardioides cynanchi TaxID=2558918 RepID=UPI00192D7790|nr:GNAT family N-acetyltransferase [Nocardioides cynanchi]